MTRSELIRRAERVDFALWWATTQAFMETPDPVELPLFKVTVEGLVLGFSRPVPAPVPEVPAVAPVPEIEAPEPPEEAG